MTTEPATAPLTPNPNLGSPRFDAELRADQATKLILQDQLQAMAHNESGVLQRGDEEFLHDYRIAVRRTRSALGQIKEIFPAAATSRFRARFAQLAAITAPARDYDVYLLGFDELKTRLPEPYRDALEPLRGVLQQQTDLAYGQLFRHLTSPQYRQFVASWRQFLQAPPVARPHASRALATIGELAEQRIWKLYRRAIKQGQVVKSKSPPESIHKLRKTCKKLRYLIEFFHHFYPAEPIQHGIKVLKRLQDYLGEFQDVFVQAETLRQLGPTVRKQQDIPTETLLAMGVLLGQLDRQQRELREDFPKRFKVFASDEHQAEYRKLFRRHTTLRPSVLAPMNDMV